jgi:hypothetical protein
MAMTTASPAAAEPERATDGPTPRSIAMGLSLGALLDRVQGSRHALPLMAALEQSLRTVGLKAIDGASMSALSRIASQLSTLPVADDDDALRDLQAYLLARLSPPPAPLEARPGFQPSFISSPSLEVSEGSLSDFMAVEKSFHRSSD